jgi:hypothetical protein
MILGLLIGVLIVNVVGFVFLDNRIRDIYNKLNK